MTHPDQLFKPVGHRLMVVLLTAAAAVALLLLTQGSTARAATCEGGVFCVWTGTFYNGNEYNATCSGGSKFFPPLEMKSAKNRCGVNVHIGWEEGGSTNWKACMSPGGERPEPGRFNVVIPGGC
jgi:hypothetical protein